MRSLLLSLALLLTMIPTALAQEEASGEEAEAAPPSATPYFQALRRGMEKVVGGDLSGALVDLREAVGLEPQRPEAHCHLATALRLSGENGAALEEYRSCANTASAMGDAVFRARGLLGAADALEAIPGRLGEARDAWNALLEFAQANPAQIAPAVAQVRLSAIEAATAQERRYMDVRQRIAER
ncbi:MAG: hypothetical protein OEY14_12290, partial [Myxococcales bacterium]|nr:hypothetical protein [Myxococcales bacterium]